MKRTEIKIPALRGGVGGIKCSHILKEEEEVFTNEQNCFKNTLLRRSVSVVSSPSVDIRGLSLAVCLDCSVWFESFLEQGVPLGFVFAQRSPGL